MQSLYKVIKSGSVVSKGEKTIETNYEIKDKEQEIKEENSKNYIDSYENLAKNILENARKKAEDFLSKAYDEAKIVEEEAFKKGYEKGYEEGHEKGMTEGYKESYEAYIEKGKAAYKEMVDKSDELLLNSENQYKGYLKEKEDQVRQLIVTIVEEVLIHEVKDKDSMNDIIHNNLEESKKSTSFVVKCNNTYYEVINSKIEFWKSQLPYKGEIFIINDISLKDGEVVIETEQGKVISSIDKALDKIKEILINEK